MEFWMVWVAGRVAPKILHESFESAITEAERIKHATGREIYILKPVHKIEGRKLISLKGKGGGKLGQVEPRQVA